MLLADMEVDGNPGFVDSLFTTETQQWLPSVRQIKNASIGNNKQKTSMMKCGIVPRLLQFMIDETSDIELRIESAVVLGSFAKGTKADIEMLLDYGCLSVLLKDISHPNLKYVEACLRCLRTIFTSEVASVDVIYQDLTIVPHMLSIISKSSCTQECITNILANCCTSALQQSVLCSNGIVSALAPLLCSDIYRVQMPTLKCFSQLCYQNQHVSLNVAMATHNGQSLPNMFVKLLARDKPLEMQMAAATCLAYIYRAGALNASDPMISLKSLPTLVRMCKRDKDITQRVKGAETLAYLIEVDIELQRIAAWSDHLILTMAEYLRYVESAEETNGNGSNKKEVQQEVSGEMKQAAFRVFASLGANDEDIRKRIIETENLMDHLVVGLYDESTKVQLSAVRCMHSLSRSVQQLRTSFSDHTVWKPLMKLLQNASEEVLTVASSTLCNLLLEFSPSKEPILESGAVELLVNLTKKENPALRVNGIWALMNMTFQADHKIKTQILNALGTDQLFCLLSDSNVDVLMKTLGLLRNLLSNKSVSQDIDDIMRQHGNDIMQAVILILEGDHPIDVKEQTLCILANVADGVNSKDFIMSNEDVLKKLMTYMIHANVRLQIAATFCISNLIWSEESGAFERQAKLREMGVQKLLQQLLSTNDTTLFDKVKTALQQFT
ncbi:unnamed protein product [Owenia fusiformis]|uniref:Armadillo repeat-containing protein 8 n=1 Tax=Owenia fusiformis TaxID=6347 RepID=A0A8J1XSX7_OWEFU|nr:unnamed protein product [Owenia fusiformis]